MLVILFLLAIVGGFAFWANRKSKAQLAAKNQAELDDAIADARRWIERLGSQVLSLSGTDAASTQAIADASERIMQHRPRFLRRTPPSRRNWPASQHWRACTISMRPARSWA